MSNDEKTPRSIKGKLILALIGVFVFAAVILPARNGTQTTKDCGPDQAECYAQRHVFAAQRACEKAVTEQAKYRARFDYSLDGMFDRYTVRGSSIVYSGERAEFENGFGAWSRMRYTCEFEPGAGSAVASVVER
ncbi:MAG: hypothetical protein ACPGJF_03220 [Sinimarinibacterium flocculans]|uniref:hypothetical protein n=1 Tax=Sinimarinibacterium flocculans TaxID=985250 RepID=UPI003C3F0ED8